MRAATAALALLLVLAGCSGLDGTVPVATDTETAEPATPTPSSPTADPTATLTTTTSATDTPAPTPTESPTPTSTPTPTTERAATLSDDNPWDQRIVRVAVNDTVRDGRNTTAIVEAALAYWNAHVETYTGYALRFRLADDDARIEVRFVDRIDDCDGPANHTAGCAPLIEPDQRARDRAVARVVSDRSNTAVIGTTKHELGHLLGLDHDADPRFLMAQNSTTPVRNASDRPNPWYADTVRVAVDYDSIDADRATVDNQVGHAVDYYDAGAEGTIPSNVTVARTDRTHTAEILVTNSPEYCTVEDGSQVGMEGQNTDGDKALEAHVRATICVDVDGEAVGWHVGYWLGTAFGLEKGERAAVFRNADYDDRRSEWWE